MATSEEVWRREDWLASGGEGILDLEMVHADAADVIIVLIGDPRSDGVETEVDRLSQRPLLFDRVRVLVPRERAKAAGVAREAMRRVPEHQRFEYTKAMYATCLEMRAQAIDWVESVRRHKFFEALTIRQVTRR